jgi:hypothetical protein
MHGMPHTALQVRRKYRRTWINCSWWISLLLFATVPVSALEVQDLKWGFDGQVVPGRFNLLSVLVANPDDAPFDGTVNFYKSRGLEERIGAIYGTPCYLSPLVTRWLQFYVYIDNDYDQWRLEWGHGPDDHHDIQPPKWGPPATVLLSDSDATLSTISAIKQFPEDLFPPTVAATSGLGSLLLDRAPRWEPAKRQAFLDWLRAGGKVHLLMGADGRYPVFSDELGILNSSRERVGIGAGVVVRHAVTSRTIQIRDVQEGDIPMRKDKPGEPTGQVATADSFFRALAPLAQRHYSWGLIYLLAIAYAALVGPAQLKAGRKIADYRLRIALLLVVIAGFALLFNMVGRRGQGEASVIHSLSYARAIDGDTYDVMQWVNIFAVRGDHYTITHAAPHNLYATGQDYEPVNGVIENGKDGQFIVDMPMFSRRAFLHAAEMKNANLQLKIVSWDGADTLKQLILSVGPDFRKQTVEGWAVQGDQIYPMLFTKDGLKFEDSVKQSLNAFVSASGSQQVVVGYGGPDENEVTNVESQFRKCVKPLITWSLGAKDFTQPMQSTSAANGRVQVFLFAHSPESFCVTGSELGHEIGYVLYHFDLIKPGTVGGI